MAHLGGREAFATKLDSIFTSRRYWHGNEPCHQVAWMFVDAGMPEKTQQYVRHIMDTEYHTAPGGLSGNDDAGQMSAWYVFAALGFYSVCPATPDYTLASPLFDRAEILLGNGRTFTIIAHRISPKANKIKSITLNGQPHTAYSLTHAQILAGSTLEFTLTE